MAKLVKFFVISTLFLLNAATVLAQAPTITPATIDLGKVSTPTTAVATLHNTTNKPLLIIKVDADCHCTKTTYSRHPIAIGDSTTITVSYTPTSGDGVFYKAVTVQTTASKEPLKFIIRGTNL